VALDLATTHGARLTLLHVCRLPPNLPRQTTIHPPGGGAPQPIDQWTAHGVRARLESIGAPLVAKGFDVDALAVVSDTGDESSEILRVAGETKADAIVLGTHGRKGLAHLLLGSVAEKVIRGAAVPVVAVRSDAPEATLTPEESLAEDEMDG
jgi:nucleotide-binding universal stress UspA family protein